LFIFILSFTKKVYIFNRQALRTNLEGMGVLTKKYMELFISCMNRFRVSLPMNKCVIDLTMHLDALKK
jgi:hypothetical protein